jgi:hypothetical protein
MNDATQLIDNNGQLGQHRLSSAVEMGVMVGWSAAHGPDAVCLHFFPYTW